MAAASRLGGMPALGAYLDLVDPDLAAVTAALAAAGHSRAVVTPLLFTEAFHSTVDVPAAVAQAADASGVELVLTDILGTGDDMLDVVSQSIRLAGVGHDASILLATVGSSSAPANRAIEDFARRLSAARDRPVAVAFCTRDPRPAAVLAVLDPPMAIVPLFLSPGLLLDPLVTLAAELLLTMTAPLASLAAPVLLSRYRRALAETSGVSAKELRPVSDLR